jgi:hypothetical protein
MSGGAPQRALLPPLLGGPRSEYREKKVKSSTRLGYSNSSKWWLGTYSHCCRPVCIPVGQLLEPLLGRAMRTQLLLMLQSLMSTLSLIVALESSRLLKVVGQIQTAPTATLWLLHLCLLLVRRRATSLADCVPSSQYGTGLGSASPR